MTLYVNSSLLRLLNECETATWIRWGQEREMREQEGPGPATIGQILHALMAAYYAKEAQPAIFETVWDAHTDGVLPKQERLYPENVKRVWEHWRAMQDLQRRDWTVLATEKSFEVPLGVVAGEEVIYYGTPDMDIFWKGEHYIVDSKTTGNMEDGWEHQWQMSAQLQGYVWARRAQGHNVKGAFVNGLEVRRLPPWNGDMGKRCATHKLPYSECQALHVKHAWIGPLWWSDARLTTWRMNALSMVHRLRAIRDGITEARMRPGTPEIAEMYLALTTMDGQFKWPGCKRCQYRRWCNSGRPLQGLDRMMIHSPWKRDTREEEEDV